MILVLGRLSLNDLTSENPIRTDRVEELARNMYDESAITNCEVLASYAADNLRVWKRMVEQGLVHKSFGRGKVTGVERSASQGKIRLVVLFDRLPPGEAEKKFMADSLPSFFDELTVPGDLEGFAAAREHLERQREAERQREKERADAAHFATLKSKYAVERYEDGSPSSPLYTILLLLEEDRDLEDKHIEWLEHEKLFEPIAWFYEMLADKTGDQWNIPRASSYWRSAQRPRRVVLITEEFSSSDQELMSAVLTTRGAAFRDLKNLPEATRCAHKALEHNPENFRTYNLLGALSYQYGNPEQGDEYFAEAIELGASPEMQDKSIRRSLSAAEGISRKETALYLLEKDPERYSWAEHYLQ